MKRFTFMLLAAFMAVMSYAQPFQKAPFQKALHGKTLQTTLASASQQMRAPIVAADGDESVVEAPEGLTVEEYGISARNYDDDENVGGSVFIGFDGNDVYVKGLCTWIPEAWVKGTLEGTTVTFAQGQYFGNYDEEYDMYLNTLLGEDVVFTYDSEAGTFTAQNTVFLVDNDTYYFDSYRGAVLTKVIEKATMPANPVITDLVNDEDYGYYLTFNVPTVDVDGNPLVSSKLSYELFTDIDGEVAPLTFTPATHELLTENLTVIPYGFTEGWDFYTTSIYLNDLFSEDWDKLGIKSIYTGGGETNETEIQWFEIEKTAPVTGNVWVAAEQGYENAEDVTNITIAEGVTGVFDKADGNNAPKYYNTGTSVRTYAGNTFTLTSAGEPIVKVEFTFDATKAPAFDVSTGEMAISEDNTSGTWTGEASEIVFSVPNVSGQQTRIQSIKVTLLGGEAPDDDELVTLPEGVEAEVWTLEGSYATSQGSQNVQNATEVAFDGNDVYVKGLAYYFPEAWLKGTIENGVATFPSGQFVGEDEYGKEYMLGSADGKTISDIQFTYDSETQTLTQLTSYILENGDTKTEFNFYGYWTGVQLYAGEPIVIDPVVAPEGLVTETYKFNALSYENTEAEEDEEGEESEESEGTWEAYEAQVQVGFDGDDLYIQGLSADYAEGWVKATKNEAGQYVIPANQFMGTYDVGGLGWFVYDYFFTAVNEEGELVDVVLNYDAENNTLSTNQMLALNGSKNSLYYYLLFQNVTITKMEEFAATPATPEVTRFNGTGSYPSVDFNIPAKSTEGEDLIGALMTYTIYIEKDGQEQPLTLTADLYQNLEEDITAIPYTYDDSYDIYAGGARVYLNQDIEEIQSWTKIGVKSTYTAAGETHESATAWFDLVAYWTEVGIADVNTGKQSVTYYDMQGRKANAQTKGLLIRQARQADGTVKTVKVLRP